MIDRGRKRFFRLRPLDYLWAKTGKAVKGAERLSWPLTAFLGFAISLKGQEKFVDMAAFTVVQENMKKPITAFHLACYRLCVCASGSLITDILSCFTLISVSCLHFGQNSGKCSSTVSSLIFKRVLLLQIGQSTHSLFMLSLNFFTKSLQIWRQLFSAILG